MKPTVIVLLCFIFSKTVGQIQVHEEPMHQPVLTKSGTRVLDVIAQPGDTSLLHQHANNYCYITVKGGTVWLESAGEKGRKVELPMGFIGGYYENPSSPLVHRFANLSPEPIQLIAVENLSSLGNQADSVYSINQNEEVIITNPYFLVTKILISAKASLEIRPKRSSVIVNLESKPIRYKSKKKEGTLDQWVWIDSGSAISFKNQFEKSAWIVLVQVRN